MSTKIQPLKQRRTFAENAAIPLDEEIIHRVYRTFFDIGRPGLDVAMSNRIITEETLNELIAGLRSAAAVDLPVITFIGGIDPDNPSKMVVGFSMLSMNDLDVQDKVRGYGIARSRALEFDRISMEKADSKTAIHKRAYIANIANDLAFFVARCRRAWPDLKVPSWIVDLQNRQIVPVITDEEYRGRRDEEELGEPIGEMVAQTAEDVFLGGKEAPLPGGFTNTVQRAAEAPIGRETVRNFAKVGDERGFNPNKDTQPA